MLGSETGSADRKVRKKEKKNKTMVLTLVEFAG